MKTAYNILFLLFSIAAFTMIFGCRKETESPQQYSLSLNKKVVRINHGHHRGVRDSASASQPNYEFPPLVSDTVRFSHPLFNSGLASYDSAQSTYTILLNGNYTVDVTCFRDTPNPAPATNLMLYVNGNLVYDTGFPSPATGIISIQHFMHLFPNDVVYVRTQDCYHTVMPGGTFSIRL